jgi:hypothetical protein
MMPPASSASSTAAAAAASSASASASSAASASSTSTTAKQSTGKSSSQASFVNRELIVEALLDALKEVSVAGAKRIVLRVDLLCYLYPALSGKDMDKCNAALGLLFGAGDAISVDSVDALYAALQPVSDSIHRVIAALPSTAEVRVELLVDGPTLDGVNLKVGTQRARAASRPDLRNALRGLMVDKNQLDAATTKLLLQHVAQHLPKNSWDGIGEIAAVLVAQQLAGGGDTVHVIDLGGERAAVAPSSSSLESAQLIVQKLLSVRTSHAVQTLELDADADDAAFAATASTVARDALLSARPASAPVSVSASASAPASASASASKRKIDVAVMVVPGEAEAGAVMLAVNNVIADDKVVVVVLSPDTDAAIAGLRQAALLDKQQQSRLLITDGDKGESLASIVANCAAFGGAGVVALAFFLLGTDLTPSLLAKKAPFVKACSLIASAAKKRRVDVDKLVVGDLSDAFEQLGIELDDDAVVPLKLFDKQYSMCQAALAAYGDVAPVAVNVPFARAEFAARPPLGINLFARLGDEKLQSIVDLAQKKERSPSQQQQQQRSKKIHSISVFNNNQFAALGKAEVDEALAAHERDERAKQDEKQREHARKQREEAKKRREEEAARNASRWHGVAEAPRQLGAAAKKKFAAQAARVAESSRLRSARAQRRRERTEAKKRAAATAASAAAAAASAAAAAASEPRADVGVNEAAAATTTTTTTTPPPPTLTVQQAGADDDVTQPAVVLARGVATDRRLRVAFFHSDEAVCSVGRVVELQDTNTLSFAQCLPRGRWTAALVDDVTGVPLCRTGTVIEPRNSAAEGRIKCNGLLGLLMLRAEADEDRLPLHKTLKVHVKQAPTVRVAVADAFGNDITDRYDVALSLSINKSAVRVQRSTKESDQVLFELLLKGLKLRTECLVEFAVTATPKAGGAAIEKCYKLRFEKADVNARATKFHVDLGADESKKERKFKVDGPQKLPRVKLQPQAALRQGQRTFLASRDFVTVPPADVLQKLALSSAVRDGEIEAARIKTSEMVLCGEENELKNDEPKKGEPKKDEPKKKKKKKKCDDDDEYSGGEKEEEDDDDHDDDDDDDDEDKRKKTSKRKQTVKERVLVPHNVQVTDDVAENTAVLTCLRNTGPLLVRIGCALLSGKNKRSDARAVRGVLEKLVDANMRDDTEEEDKDDDDEAMGQDDEVTDEQDQNGNDDNDDDDDDDDNDKKEKEKAEAAERRRLEIDKMQNELSRIVSTAFGTDKFPISYTKKAAMDDPETRRWQRAIIKLNQTLRQLEATTRTKQKQKKWLPSSQLPTATHLAAPSANARARTHRYDVRSLRQLLSLSTNVTDKAVWDIFYGGNGDGTKIEEVLTALVRSSRAGSMRVTSAQVCGETVSLTMTTERAHSWSRIGDGRGGDATLSKLIAAGKEDDATFAKRAAWQRRWIERCLVLHCERLYHHKSYMSGVAAAEARRGRLHAVRLLEGAVAQKRKEKVVKPSASAADFGLGSDVFERLTKELGPFDLRSGHAFSGRLLREGLVRLRTAGDFQKLMRCVVASGDPGQKTLCSWVIGSLRVRSNATAEQNGLVQYWLSADASIPIDVPTLWKLAAALKFEHITHEVRGSRRGRHDLDAPTADSRTAATALAQAAATTGGHRALTQQHYKQFIDEYCTQHFAPLWAANCLRAYRGARRLRMRSVHQRRMADLRSLADGIARWRCVLWGEARDAGNEDECKRLEAEIERTVTKFDDDVLVFIGQQIKKKAGDKLHHKGHKSSPMIDFVEEVAKRYRTFTVSEFNTSQKCSHCGSQLTRTRAGQVRFVRCEKSHLNGTGNKQLTKTGNQVLRNGKRRHVAEQNKDYVAALSMARIGLWLLIDGTRPAPWCTDAQRAAYEERMKKEHGGARKEHEHKGSTSTTTTNMNKKRSPNTNSDALDDLDDNDLDDDDNVNDSGEQKLNPTKKRKSESNNTNKSNKRTADEVELDDNDVNDNVNDNVSDDGGKQISKKLRVATDEPDDEQPDGELPAPTTAAAIVAVAQSAPVQHNGDAGEM